MRKRCKEGNRVSNQKNLAKLRFFNYNIHLIEKEKKTVGRPSTKQTDKETRFKYELGIDFIKDEIKIAKIIEREMHFCIM